MKPIDFKIEKKISNGRLGRVGILSTPHGEILTPAFATVGTKGSVKSLTPEQVKGLGAQVVLANTYHLYLQPGEKVMRDSGGIGKFMNWSGPTMTDSGGFQAFSLGAAFGTKMNKLSEVKQEVSPAVSRSLNTIDERDDMMKMARITEDGVEFKSVLDGSVHFFTPERSMEIQNAIGADLLFAFDECTSPIAPFEYQKEAMNRTHKWAARSLGKHNELQVESEKLKVGNKHPQALFGIVQGGRFPDLRKESAKIIGAMDFDGFGIGGSFEKKDMNTAVGWVNSILPEEKPRHLLGIGDPFDLWDAVEEGCDLFDCVAPTRIARHGTLYTPNGLLHITGSSYRNDFSQVVEECECYTCTNFTKAYLGYLFRAREFLAYTLASIHNLYFIINLVKGMRQGILDDNFSEKKDNFFLKYKK
ncbi:MAG: tRNA guanosine(34) transglycosylase Tgt [Candidatus Taylorbacteria bacterium]|nr:tRNA guanosine(34) transglycosylase Tgt [Candidatus Taylorbacteria bacterium]